MFDRGRYGRRSDGEGWLWGILGTALLTLVLDGLIDGPIGEVNIASLVVGALVIGAIIWGFGRAFAR